METGPTRRSRRVQLLAVVVATAATMFGPPGPDARADDGWTATRIEAYVVGDVGPLGNTVGHVLQSRCGFGTLCFGRTVGDSFTVTIEDDSGRTVGGVIRITDSGGRTVLHRPFCGTSGAIPVWPGELRVHVDAPGDVGGAHWFGGPGCTDVRPLGATGATTRGATSGRVRVTFRAGDSPSVARAQSNSPSG